MSGGRGDVSRGLRAWGPWMLLLVVLGVGLAIGAGVGGRPSLDQQTRAIASEIRCPSCSDLNAAQSNAVTAVAVRNAIRQRLQQGQSAPQIEAYLESRYGPDILLRPSGRGLGSLVWVLPVALAVAAAAAVGSALWRWRGRAGPPGSPPDAASRRRVEDALGAAKLGAAKLGAEQSGTGG
ncbi:MAG TPA: cytochrome c-type biogenesis protein CcmH [Acidimicrobiales bacterium]|nr:cytochrome c-type biogenesis protein CcmH [Acidimicrobiales bacterium]